MADIFGRDETPPAQPPVRKSIELRISHPDAAQVADGVGVLNLHEARVELLINGEPFDLTLCQEVAFQLRAEDMLPVVTLTMVATDVRAVMPYGDVRKKVELAGPGTTPVVGGHAVTGPVPTAVASPAEPPGGSIVDPAVGVDQLRLQSLLNDYNRHVGQAAGLEPTPVEAPVVEPADAGPPVAVTPEPISEPPVEIVPQPVAETISVSPVEISPSYDGGGSTDYGGVIL